MKAFILAAGFGERLKPVTNTIPKPLIPVLGIPSICYAIALLKEAGITHAVCNLHYRSRDIIDFFEKHDYFGMTIEFSIEEEILGTGGGLKRCESFFKDDDFIIINSDIITDIDLNRVLDHHKEASAPASVVVYSKEDTGNDGTVSIAGGQVVDFKNSLESGITPEFEYMGIAVASPVLFDYLEKGFSSVVYTGFTGLIKDHSLGYYTHMGMWEDIGTIENLEATEKKLKETESPLPERVTRATGLGGEGNRRPGGPGYR
ncbi:MAG: nucleotidyltransferase family protein [bacterium]|nr:nucleotidyltransferase family protein [bacterium]